MSVPTYESPSSPPLLFHKHFILLRQYSLPRSTTTYPLILYKPNLTFPHILPLLTNLSTPHLSFTSPAAFHFPAIFHFRILLPLPHSSYTSAPTFRLPVYFFHFPSHHSLPLSPLTSQPILQPPPPLRSSASPPSCDNPNIFDFLNHLPFAS